ncbi:MAG: Spy/CpxP family protein refolding chaperone [Gemmatimonadaceae bacterium]
MRFSRHQLLALVLGAGMATTLPAQQARRAGARQNVDSVRAARMAARQGSDTGRLVAALAARRADGGGSPAAMILNQREKLGLTDDQVNRLETLKASFVASEPAQADMLKLRQELATASQGEANIPAARAAMNKINEASTSAMVARLEAHNRARSVLNADQQAQFDQMEARRPMAGMMMGMGGAGGRAGDGAGGRGGRGRGGPPPTIPPGN